jgi:glutamate-5-semialdehyde dehydrogenase
MKRTVMDNDPSGPDAFAPGGPATADLAEMMAAMGRRARAAARRLALAPRELKDAALLATARALREGVTGVVAANREDVAEARRAGRPAAFIDRLLLDETRVAAVADGLDCIADLADPVGRVLERWRRPNGLAFERVATPLGVVGVIFESRPNVTADAGGLCLKAGNAAILRSGSDGLRTSLAIHAALVAGLEQAGLPADAIQLVPLRDRDVVGHMLAGLDGNLDVIVPRGGRSLVARVQQDARVPVFAHLDGIVHLYVHAAADPDMAVRLAVNSKMRRTGICGAAETLLVDRAVAGSHLPGIVAALLAAGCEVRGEGEVSALPGVAPARQEDFGHEFLESIIAVKLVDGLDAAMAHIASHGSSHTDAIVTEDAAAAARFLSEVDSAIVLHNASTQFADGGEFGFGAEIGIATGRMHARGPVGLEQLCSFNYRVRGTGQTRP